MKDNKVAIWIGQKDLNHDPKFMEEAGNEFARIPLDKMAESSTLEQVGATRRDFLKYLGFGLGAATVAAACEIPVRKAIPYVVKPDAIVPGVANYYASSFVKGGDYCAVLVKTREGRPIKIEGNDLSPVTMGGTSARAQATVLELYDVNRIKGPGRIADGLVSDGSWAAIDKEVIGALRPESKIRILSNTLLSPALHAAIAEFSAAYPNTKLVQYDAVSSAAMLIANEQQFGMKTVPDYHFDGAKVIIGFEADFLGTWISPIEYAKGYVKNRKIEHEEHATMSRHYHVESHMSLTGSNADNRILVKPSEQGAAIAALYNEIASQTGGTRVNAPAGLNEKATAAIKAAAKDLLANKGASLVVSGSNMVSEQLLVNQINLLLGNYGKTITFEHASKQRQGDERDVARLIEEMQGGQVDVLFILGANPSFDLPQAEAFNTALEQVPLRISTNSHVDETTGRCHWAAPDHHILESWGDVEPKAGVYSLMQPTINPLFDTRQVGLSFLTWAKSAKLSTGDQPYHDFIQELWKENMFPHQSEYSVFQAFWDHTLHNGVFNAGGNTEPAYNAVDVSGLQVRKPAGEGMELSLFETVNMGAGQYANNPWLQEMPDPVNRCVWGNYLSVPVSFDGWKTIEGFAGLKDGDLVNLTSGESSLEVPVIQQFGQMDNTFGIAMGYGRTAAGRCGNDIGVNVQSLVQIDNGLFQYYRSGIQVSGKAGREDHFACVQYHHTMGVKTLDKNGDEINADEAALASVSIPFFKKTRRGFQGALTDRSIIHGAHVSELETFLEELHEQREEFQHLNAQSLYPDYSDHYSRGHHWGMHIDLNACIGCGACTVACMSENNVPVVGKHNVARHQEMTWIRIDRYFYGDFENPKTVYQPMMCQHCDNAPCENVCPVDATNHSSEGLNQMIYNRCVGTRYCANNCPYKVRRLNWADYTTADLWPINEHKINQEKVQFYADDLTRMVLNPDVTVRSRGVMEKCSFCVQRIQEGKLNAKKEDRRLLDRDVRTACQTACPTGAITFGDKNNPEGELTGKFKSPLNYIVLEETNVRSSVNYTVKVNNANEALDA